MTSCGSFGQSGKSTPLHVSLIYRDGDEKRHFISRFLAEGLDRGECVVYLADEGDADSVRAWLAEELQERGREVDLGDIEVFDALSSYCPEGHFSIQAMLTKLGDMLDGIEAAGGPGLRVTAEMTWALKGIPGSEGLMEYEARVGELMAMRPFSAVCQYDARRFDGRTLYHVLQTHPFVATRKGYVANPASIQPAEFLRRL
ncbi:MAG: MEDS domain-containing protein [Rectinemataceae bacterium]